ncbi:immunoglobulin domain protein [Necator americanus]|uniref:Immunoglobulin domain protein n=1 Tax=Necator americanus TaxID=51031 RepID=W2SLH1_NECAM|nr:immunoglobulin domain protein [Necator americanus]ETN69716.1 immunoglobulin domain protein [Necator americanus]
MEQTCQFSDGRQPLPSHAEERGGVLTISQTRKSDEGHYVCTAHDPQSGASADAPPAHIAVRQRELLIVTNVSLAMALTPQRIILASKLQPQVDPIEQTVPEGSPFRIRCWVPGNPHVHLTWRRAHGDFNEDSEQNQGIFTVNRAELTDAGEYICSAEDPRTGEEAEAPPATVHVTPPTTVPDVGDVERGPQVSPPEQTVPEGDPASIRCWVEGKPDAELSWKRADGTPLPFGATDEDGILAISSTLKSDEGDYVCTYHPPDGRPKESSPSRLNVKAPGGPPRPVATPPVLTVKRGEPARFHCDAHSPTPAQINWGHGDADSDLPDGVVHEVDDITIEAADESHEGEYVCSATNEFGTGIAEPVKLIVTDEEQPPTARVEPRVWNGKPGDRHQFKCITTGIPTPKVHWSGPNNSPLPHDVTELDGNVLDFANGRTELNGDYTCTATNPVGEASDYGSVNIGPSLTVKTTPAGPRLILTVGEPLHVKCEAFGEPEPEVEWLHDPGPERGDLPDDYKPVTISEQFIRHPAIGLGNAGAYTCKGSNSHATATKNIYIEVVEPSRVATVSILGGSSQWFEQGEPSQLICTATGSSLVDDQLPTDVEEHNEPGLLHFPNFKNSYAGEYECRGYRNNELIASSSVMVYSSTDETEDAKCTFTVPDTIIQVLLDVSSESVNVGDRAWFDCKVTGDPSAVIMWSKEGADELPENSQVTGGRLLFNSVTQENAGVYKCRAKTKAGPLETRTVLNIGSSKRKRKHTRGRHARRSHRRRAANASATKKHEQKHSLAHSTFGSWFSTH